MKKLFILSVLTCFLIFIDIEVKSQETTRVARSIDSFGRINADDAGARADNFATQLANEPEMDGYIISYGPDGNGSGTANFIIQAQVNYFVQTRGVDRERLITINAGRDKDPADARVEYWLVPHGDAPPKVKHFNISLKKFNGKCFEYRRADDTDYADDGGPTFGGVSVAACVDLLQHQEDSVVYIVAYNHKLSSPGLWRRVANQDVEMLESYGLKKDRIKVVFGGISKEIVEEFEEHNALIEFWIVAKDEPPPVKEAKPEKTPKTAFKINVYSDYWLKFPEKERSIFSGFADVVRGDPNLSLYIITRPRIEAMEKVSPDEPDDIDTRKLGQKWKAELVEKFGISENRIFCIEAAATEFKEGEIEVWVTPAGVPLPNPLSPEDEEQDN